MYNNKGLIKPKPGIQLNRAHPLARGLVGYWLFNEGSGGKIYSVISGIPGTLTNFALSGSTSNWVGSPMGGCLDFDGSNDYIDTTATLTTTPTSSLTLVCWYRSTDTDGILIGKAAATNQYHIDLHCDLVAATKTLVVGQATTTITLVSNQLYCGVLVQDNGVVYHYVNGQLKGSLTINATVLTSTTNTNPWLIGERQSNGAHEAPANAKIDEVRIYNRALNLFEIQTLYANPHIDFHGSKIKLLIK